MKKLIVLGLMAFAISCSKKTKPEEEAGRCGVIYTCINEKVNTFSQSSQICDSTASVKHYTFQNMGVYLFDQGSCGNDFTTTVLNEQCDTLGYLGGIVGNTKINGVEFESNATFNYVVWSN